MNQEIYSLVPSGFNDKIRKITLKDFFSDFFSENEYDEYVSGARKAVEDAYKYVGMQTITNLTYQDLPYFLQTALYEIVDFPYWNAWTEPSGTWHP